MKRALLFVNAGSRQGKELRGTIAPALRKAGLEVIEASESNPEGFSEIIHRFFEKIDLVVVAGGDGTCMSAAKVLLKTSLPLGIIPLGTANNLARSLKIPESVDEAARIIGEANVISIDVATVNDYPFLNVSGMGISTFVNRFIPAQTKKRWGVLGYIAYSFAVLRRSKRFRATIAFEQQELGIKSRQITVCNGRYYGAGIAIAPDASITDGQLDLVSAHFSTWWKAFLLIPVYLLKSHNPRKGLHLLRAKNFTVTTNPVLDIDTDGEVTTKTPAKYEMLPKALLVFAPKESSP